MECGQIKAPRPYGLSDLNKNNADGPVPRKDIRSIYRMQLTGPAFWFCEV